MSIVTSPFCSSHTRFNVVMFRAHRSLLSYCGLALVVMLHFIIQATMNERFYKNLLCINVNLKCTVNFKHKC